MDDRGPIATFNGLTFKQATAEALFTRREFAAPEAPKTAKSTLAERLAQASLARASEAGDDRFRKVQTQVNQWADDKITSAEMELDTIRRDLRAARRQADLAETVAALVALDFGASLYQQVSSALGPDFKGGHVHTGLGTGVIDFVLSPVWLEQGPKDLVEKAKAVWPDIQKARADIMSGALKVPFKTEL